jgi:hypothetical protein
MVYGCCIIIISPKLLISVDVFNHLKLQKSLMDHHHMGL